MRTAMQKVLIVLACVGVAACSSSRKPDFDLPPGKSAEDVRRARELTTQADRAQRDGKIDRAIELYRQAVEFDDDSIAAWNNLGHAYAAKHDLIQAAESFKRAAELNASDPRPFHNVGAVYLEAGWAEKAEEYFGLALQRAPADLSSLRGMVDAQGRLQRVSDEALDHLRKLAMIEPDDTFRKEYLLRVFQMEQRLADAKKK